MMTQLHSITGPELAQNCFIAYTHSYHSIAIFDILADSGTSTCSAINQDNLHSITIKKLDKSKLFHIAHINA